MAPSTGHPTAWGRSGAEPVQEVRMTYETLVLLWSWLFGNEEPEETPTLQGGGWIDHGG